MDTLTPTASAETMTTGEQLADQLYLVELQKAKTVGEVRGKMEDVMKGVQGSAEGEERVREIATSLDEATEGGAHDDIQLKDDLGGEGVIGRHTFDSGKAEVVKDQFTPDQVVDNTRKTLAVVIEENKPGVGHPGQDPAARVNVIKDGKKHEAETTFEGNVGVNIKEEHGIVREDAPEAVYKEGERLVEELGGDEVDSYIRKDGAHAGEHMQELVWERSRDVTFEQMMDEGREVGMSEEEIIAAAQRLDKIPSPAGSNVAMAT